MTGYYVKDETTGERLPARNDFGTSIGDTYVLRRYHNDYLFTRHFSATQEFNRGYGNDLGNPYLCKPNTTDAEHLWEPEQGHIEAEACPRRARGGFSGRRAVCRSDRATCRTRGPGECDGKSRLLRSRGDDRGFRGHMVTVQLVELRRH